VAAGVADFVAGFVAGFAADLAVPLVFADLPGMLPSFRPKLKHVSPNPHRTLPEYSAQAFAMKLRFEPIRRICSSAVDDGTVPGLVLLVAAGGEVVFHEETGARQLIPRKLPAFRDTVYDIASLTKAVATSVVAMREVAGGRLALDAPAVDLLPELAGADPERARITVRHLLSHASGLPAHRPFWRQAAAAPSERWAVSQLAAREPLERPPGVRAVYSDLGFILLGWLLERLAGARLDVQVASAVTAPLALTSTMFMNLVDDPAARARTLSERSIAATQHCPERRRVLIGEVDDLNAMAMGGVAGHAGLFSTAADLSAIAAALVRAWRGDDGGGALVPRDVVRAFWTPSDVPESTWRLGWDGPALHGSQAGARFPRSAVGHLGFTGCSLWIDPDRETWIVLLSNRVHPSVPTNDRFRRLRPVLHDAISEALGY
jgi:CubicO group peptidase (beta-lactamase class C family)